MANKIISITAIISVALVGLTLCFSCSSDRLIHETGPIDNSEMKDGVYTGSFFRFPNKAVVKVTIKDKLLTNIDIISHFNGKGKKAEVPTINEIIQKQSTKVDAVTGATNSSNVIMCAVQAALEKSYETADN